MRILIVEDEFTSRKLLTALLSDFGRCDTASDGVECVDAFRKAIEENDPYDLVCMDIMMPNKDGHQALKDIRTMEQEAGVSAVDEAKVIMITALNDPKTVVRAYYKGGAAAYLPKPIEVESLYAILRNLALID
ncbi:MAG: response regulator [Pseudodesulfovibrio sp.]|jgi:two-component system chemotaxis response regulator CheY|uniref:Two-component system chemotaxis response regulator CheY n=1 Tax=Pseudodesulfovibrio indicus TaxID=1716143 RepID=A0A126QNY0_9BACT|nr:response regulator [Pseudodesulfovibrio indicus]AMK11604.1 two-component system response regulator [Pseudodesulfovibrio indicus]TDT90012.1 two-component system chemotaxis response regulator CheY [Pseudodesulfovibrio indicus]